MPHSVLHYLKYWALGIIVVYAAVLALIVSDLIRVRSQERLDTVEYPELDEARMRKVRRRDDPQMHSHLVAVTDYKPGKLRTRNLSTVYRVLQIAHDYYFNKGWLGSISTIHSARWVTLDDGRFVFFANYDFSFSGYLGQFSDQVGTTAVFGHSEGFPRPHMLMWDGARSEQLFKDYARSKQLESLVWYSAYPTVTAQDMERAIRLCEALKRTTDTKDSGLLASFWRAWRPPLDDAAISEILRRDLKAG
jgi:hypothetical protein